MNGELDPQARSEPLGRWRRPSRQHHPARRVEVAPAHLVKQFGGPIRLGDRVVVDKENVIRRALVNRTISREARTKPRLGNEPQLERRVARELLDYSGSVVSG